MVGLQHLLEINVMLSMIATEICPELVADAAGRYIKALAEAEAEDEQDTDA